MRHQVYGKKLGRTMGQRNALFRTMITQLFEHERIITTKAKAQAIRPDAEHIITQAKRGLASGDAARVVYLRRLINGRVNNPDVMRKVFDVYAPRYAERPGGYTRILKIGPRKGDNSEMVILELVDNDLNKPKETTQAAASAQPTSGARNLLRRIRGGAGNTPAVTTGSDETPVASE